MAIEFSRSTVALLPIATAFVAPLPLPVFIAVIFAALPIAIAPLAAVILLLLPIAIALFAPRL
ncbi:hypothetical protein [Neisseria sp. Marseille-Q6792]|uniref:hypothetical protein n=1 Tax=Neisseria sp. Marseille-Q6792 TaxID=2937985 RepID=UPI0020246578|nr:hypothetical protein [Neisseria sp. Marseille-Q6792]